jgi:hypothetical protein
MLTAKNNDDPYLTAILISPTLGPMSKFCAITLWVHIGNSIISNLQLSADVAFFVSNAADFYGDYDYLGSIDGPFGKDWKQFRITIGRKPAGFLIDLYAYTQYSNSYDAYLEIGLDDVVFEGCEETPDNTTFICEDGNLIAANKYCDFVKDCPDGSDEKYCGTCDFETSTCGWYDAKDVGEVYGVNMAWSRKTGPSSNSYGPQIDHTLQSNSGSYMLTERKNGSPLFYYYSLLVSPTFRQIAKTCKATFWAHLGSTGLFLFPHQIDIYVSLGTDLVGDTEYKGSVFGPIGTNWQQFVVELGARPAGYVLDFSGFNQFSNNILTEIAIDDIVFENCAELVPDPDETFDCGDGSFLSASKVCNFIQDCANGIDEKVCGNCDFERSFCNWYDNSYSGINWARIQALNANSGQGPSIDHTLQTSEGWYAYVDSKVGNSVDYADLVVDKNLGPSGTTCEIEFFYHMKGNTDDLLMYLATDFETSVKYTYLFEFVGDAGDKWNKAIVTLGRIREPFRIIFSAERFLNSPNNDVSIDDIKLFNCEFPEGILKYFLISFDSYIIFKFKSDPMAALQIIILVKEKHAYLIQNCVI